MQFVKYTRNMKITVSDFALRTLRKVNALQGLIANKNEN